MAPVAPEWRRYDAAASAHPADLGTRMHRLAARWLPTVRIQHPWPDDRFRARTQGRSPVALAAHAGICAGGRRQRRSLPRSTRRRRPKRTHLPLRRGRREPLRAPSDVGERRPTTCHGRGLPAICIGA
jgi:hypothetical protein